jgi:hypothetical protein
MSKMTSDSAVTIADVLIQIIAAVMKVYEEQTGKPLDLSQIKREDPL